MYVAETETGFFFNAKGEACLISITEPGSLDAKTKEGWADILRISFWDITRPIKQGFVLAGQPDEELEPIFDEQAKTIAEFIKKNWDADIIVHCKAGISRSAAVVRVLYELGWDMHPFRVHDTGGYNVVVFNKVKREFPELLPIGAE